MKIVFYVGRTYPHRSEIERLKTAGYSIGLFHDKTWPIKHPDIIDYIYKLDFTSERAFLASLQSLKNLPEIDGLLCTYENYILFKSLAATYLAVPSLSVESARASTDKFLMRQKFLEYDASITPKYAKVHSRDSLLDFARSVQYPVVIKPTNLVKSLLVNICRNESELIAAYDDTISRIEQVYNTAGIKNIEPGIIVEEFIQGQLCSVAGFTDQNGNISLCDGIVQLETAQQIGFNDNFLYSRTLSNELPDNIKERILLTAKKGVWALNMTSSPAHIEIIYNDTEAKLVEIGARIGGYRPFLYSHSYGINLLEQEARIAIGQTPNVHGRLTKLSATYELFPREEGSFKQLTGPVRIKDYTYFNQPPAQGAKVGPAKMGYKASAIIGIANDNIAAFNTLSDSIDRIEVATV